MAHVGRGLNDVSHLALHPKLTVGLHSLKNVPLVEADGQQIAMLELGGYKS